MQKRYTFKKEERLKSSKVIKQLFVSGESLFIYPFKLNWQIRAEPGRVPSRILISVSKKNFRKAIQRNQIKRLCREAYRKNKHLLNDFLEEHEIKCDFSIIYTAKNAETYSVIEKKIIILIQRLISELEIHLHQNTSTS